MAKIGVFKKIAALVTAIALVVCFAVSAGAEVNVATTTTYDLENDGDVTVTVNVTCNANEFAKGANVTYYATKDGSDVHIDQAKVDSNGTATFEFNTDEENLESAVKVGYTGASAAEDAVIDGYVITYPGGSTTIPTEAGTVTVSFAYTATDSTKVFDTVDVTGTATLGTATETGGTATVTLTGVESDVTITVVEKDAPEDVPVVSAELMDAAAIVSTDKVDESDASEGVDVNAAEGDRKLTVMGKVTNADTYGVIVTTAAINKTTMTADEFKVYSDAKETFAGLTKDAKGVFAVQLIDSSADGSFIAAGTNYYVAVYALNSDGSYAIAAQADAVAAKAPAAN